MRMRVEVTWLEEGQQYPSYIVIFHNGPMSMMIRSFFVPEWSDESRLLLKRSQANSFARSFAAVLSAQEGIEVEVKEFEEI